MNTDSDSLFPAPPTPAEVWWVAVEDTSDPSGGWLVLADPGDQGAQQIQDTFAKAGIAFMAALDCEQLQKAVEGTTPDSVIAWKAHEGQAEASIHEGEAGEVLFELRHQHPDDVLLIVERMEPAHSLLARMQGVLKSEIFEGIQMDLRDSPRGQGAWGLSLARIR